MSSIVNTKELNIRQGNILRLVDFGEHEGSEQSGKRPCIVISNDICNRFSPTITVLPITKVVAKNNIPTHIHISCEDYNIKEDSLILAEQIFTLDKRNIYEGVIDTLDAEDLQKVIEAVKIQLDIDANIRRGLPRNRGKVKTETKPETKIS